MRQHVWIEGLRWIALTALLAWGGALAQQDLEAVADDLHVRWQEAFNAGDAAGVAELYTQDAVIYMNGNVVDGPGEIEAFFQRDFDEGIGPTHIEPIETRALGEAVYAIGQWRTEIPDLEEPVGGHQMFVAERVDDTWRITRHVVNMEIPEPPAEE